MAQKRVYTPTEIEELRRIATTTTRGTALRRSSMKNFCYSFKRTLLSADSKLMKITGERRINKRTKRTFIPKPVVRRTMIIKIKSFKIEGDNLIIEY